MSDKFSFEQRLEQKQLLTPALILKMQLLTFNEPELEQWIVQKAEENPYILVEPVDPEPAGDTDAEQDFGATASKKDPWVPLDAVSDVIERTAPYKENRYEYFSNQLGLIDCADDEKDTALNLVWYVNSLGLLSYPLEKISEELDIPVSRLENGKVILQTIDGAGYGSESIREMILVQINCSGNKGTDELFAFVSLWFDDVINHRFAQLQKKGFSREKLEEIIAAIQSISFFPNLADTTTDNGYIQPDVIVRVIDGTIKYRFPKRYKLDFLIEIAKQTKNTDDELTEKLTEAKQLKTAINDRNRIFEMFMKYFVLLQQDFFLKGERHIRGVSQKEFAERIGISESTLSRIVNDKYIDTPWGIYLLKMFFSSSKNKKDRNNPALFSKQAVFHEISAIVSSENGQSPLPDERIVELLREKGYIISRRTVAKYREILSIPPASKRKSL